MRVRQEKKDAYGTGSRQCANKKANRTALLPPPAAVDGSIASSFLPLLFSLFFYFKLYHFEHYREPTEAVVANASVCVYV